MSPKARDLTASKPIRISKTIVKANDQELLLHAFQLSASQEEDRKQGVHNEYERFPQQLNKQRPRPLRHLVAEQFEGAFNGLNRRFHVALLEGKFAELTLNFGLGNIPIGKFPCRLGFPRRFLVSATQH